MPCFRGVRHWGWTDPHPNRFRTIVSVHTGCSVRGAFVNRDNHVASWIVNWNNFFPKILLHIFLRFWDLKYRSNWFRRYYGNQVYSKVIKKKTSLLFICSQETQFTGILFFQLVSQKNRAEISTTLTSSRVLQVQSIHLYLWLMSTFFKLYSKTEEFIYVSTLLFTEKISYFPISDIADI